ncbi:LytTR family DNA-binding domain-containing protein [Paraflavitalea sp. CAU 1676]|uniref:LytR/AlgR family response regulator transcription factor n=1 Tax=Paraflavitalea sp. CAU 1676 TaxID=3032598 RepID=UPI0023DAA1BD|nr:LytTR family DNA-binding domain-containing protein [Paraflavitalea sp. CAU 1676]MDF2192898.1 LytTR family DNA-binding domain-containing protein [Paraflavitalea sp. CAU 1676]
MIKAVIIDDEHHSIETLKWKLDNYCPEVQVVASFEKPAEGVAWLKVNAPDLLFLDIEMPMLNGFDVLEELGKDIPFDVIFTTAYDNFGIQAVKCSALDYLLKPVQNKELKEAIEKHQKKSTRKIPVEQVDALLTNVQAERKGKMGRIALASKESIEFVDPQVIICCEASSNYTTVYLTDNRKKVISRILKDFEDMLTPYHFFRAHNSFLVNLNQVREFIRGDGGYLLMENKMKIPVSKNRREELMNLLL